MKYRLAIFLLLLFGQVTFSGQAFSQTLNCEDSSNLSQQAMNHCSYQDWQKSDAALNVAWRLVKPFMEQLDQGNKDALAQKNLLKAQRAWLDYRDGHCDTVGAKYVGGTIAPLIINSCKANLTNVRTQELLLLLEEG